MSQTIRALLDQLARDEAHGGLLSLATLKLLDKLRQELAKSRL